MLDDLNANSGISGQCIARAIYDNIADAADELPFRKGDMLTVLEQNSGGLEGWWLCALKGMQGICPANRLRLLPGRSKLETHSLSHEQLPLTNKVVTPRRVGDVYLYGASRSSLNSCPLNYDIPPHSKSVTALPSENYDSPRSVQPQYDNPRPLYDTPKSSQVLPDGDLTPLLVPNELLTADVGNEEYDVPRPLTGADGADRTSKISFISADSHFSPMCTAPRPTGSGAGSLPSLAFSTCALSLYDVPPEPKQVIQPVKPSLPPRNRNGPQLAKKVRAESSDKPFDVVYDIPPQVSREQQPLSALRRLSTEFDPSAVDLGSVGTHELPLEFSSAKDTLAKLEQEAYCSLDKFIGDKGNEVELKVALQVLKDALNAMVSFGRGSIGNAIKADNETLSKKICQLLHPVEGVHAVICRALNNWVDGPSRGFNLQTQMAGIGVVLKADIHHLSNTIQAHAHLIFKRSPIISAAAAKNPADEVVRQGPNISVAQTSYANSRPQTDSVVPAGMCDMSQLYENGTPESLSSWLRPRAVTSLEGGDKQLLNFYGTQAKLHLLRMNASIDSFLLTIENNQPPKVFIGHSKLVILAAHRMVYIGDTAHRNVSDKSLRKVILDCSNGLCDAMRSTVLVTKTAALQFPSVSAVQAMVDAFVSISHLANNLKAAICGEY